MKVGRAFARSFMGTILAAAPTLCPAIARSDDLYGVIIFQEGGAPGLSDMNPQVLPIAQINRPETGKAVIYIETDQVGLARVQDDAKLPIKGPMIIYKSLGAHVFATAAVRADAASLMPGVKGQPQTFYLFAHLEPADGKEEMFNDYYDATHLPEVLAVPGMQWGARGRLVSQTPEEFAAPRYVALYEFRSFNLKATMDEIDRRLKAQITKPFPKGSVGRNFLVFYAGPATPLKT